jgi:hypothetical protein
MSFCQAVRSSDFGARISTASRVAGLHPRTEELDRAARLAGAWV